MRSTARFWPLLALGFMLAFVSGCSFRPLLSDVSVQPDVISPNADGDTDATNILYRLGRTADVSIYFENEQGDRFYFRDSQLRSPGEYGVAWGGVINEPLIVDDGFGPQQVLSRVLPDGVYTWTVEATDQRGNVETQSGTITLQDGDTVLPELQNFTVVPQEFRPNQDGLRDDWVSISYYLPKDVDRCTGLPDRPGRAEPASTPSPSASGSSSRVSWAFTSIATKAGSIWVRNRRPTARTLSMARRAIWPATGWSSPPP